MNYTNKFFCAICTKILHKVNVKSTYPDLSFVHIDERY